MFSNCPFDKFESDGDVVLPPELAPGGVEGSLPPEVAPGGVEGTRVPPANLPGGSGYCYTKEKTQHDKVKSSVQNNFELFEEYI